VKRWRFAPLARADLDEIRLHVARQGSVATADGYSTKSTPVSLCSRECQEQAVIEAMSRLGFEVSR
jgi:hypothetical protein